MHIEITPAWEYHHHHRKEKQERRMNTSPIYNHLCDFSNTHSWRQEVRSISDEVWKPQRSQSGSRTILALESSKECGGGACLESSLPNRIPPRRGNSIAYRSRAEDAALVARHDEDKAQLWLAQQQTEIPIAPSSPGRLSGSTSTMSSGQLYYSVVILRREIKCVTEPKNALLRSWPQEHPHLPIRLRTVSTHQSVVPTSRHHLFRFFEVFRN
jgi:hypothetical protein